MRIDDVLCDPRYGTRAPHHGMPKGHLPVRSYLSVPVWSRSGEAFGGLFFGHPQPGVFTKRAERFAVSIAAQAVAAIDNARLFSAAQAEIAQRKLAEASLLESEGRFREVVERSPFGIYVVDSAFRIAHMNKAGQLGAFRNVRPVIERDFSEAMHILWPEPVAAERTGFVPIRTDRFPSSERVDQRADARIDRQIIVAVVAVACVS